MIRRNRQVIEFGLFEFPGFFVGARLFQFDSLARVGASKSKVESSAAVRRDVALQTPLFRFGQHHLRVSLQWPKLLN